MPVSHLTARSRFRGERAYTNSIAYATRLPETDLNGIKSKVVRPSEDEDCSENVGKVHPGRRSHAHSVTGQSVSRSIYKLHGVNEPLFFGQLLCTVRASHCFVHFSQRCSS